MLERCACQPHTRSFANHATAAVATQHEQAVDRAAVVEEHLAALATTPDTDSPRPRAQLSRRRRLKAQSQAALGEMLRQAQHERVRSGAAVKRQVADPPGAEHQPRVRDTTTLRQQFLCHAYELQRLERGWVNTDGAAATAAVTVVEHEHLPTSSCQQTSDV